MPTVYDCLTCEDKPHFELHADMLTHIKEKHNFDIKTGRYKQTLKVCLDGAKGWHQQILEMDFGTFKLLSTWTSK